MLIFHTDFYSTAVNKCCLFICSLVCPFRQVHTWYLRWCKQPNDFKWPKTSVSKNFLHAFSIWNSLLRVLWMKRTPLFYTGAFSSWPLVIFLIGVKEVVKSLWNDHWGLPAAAAFSGARQRCRLFVGLSSPLFPRSYCTGHLKHTTAPCFPHRHPPMEAVSQDVWLPLRNWVYGQKHPLVYA